jgi:hypothetical protein
MYKHIARKVSKRIRRICGKYLSLYGEYGKVRLLWYTKLSPNMRKVFKRIRRICGKNLCVHGEDAKPSYASVLIKDSNTTAVK